MAAYTYHLWLVPGTYSIKAQYQSNDEKGQDVAPYWTGTVTTSEVSLKVEEPLIEDMRALQACKLYPLRAERGPDAKAYVNFIQANAAKLISRYPTSTYAVYALAEFYGLNDFTAPLEVEREHAYLQRLLKTGRETLADRTRHFAEGPDGKELKDKDGKPLTVTTEEWLRKRIEEAERICAAHPEVPMAEQIQYNVIGSYYVDLMQFQNAAKVFEKLHESATDGQIRENSARMLQVLNEVTSQAVPSRQSVSSNAIQDAKTPLK